MTEHPERLRQLLAKGEETAIAEMKAFVTQVQLHFTTPHCGLWLRQSIETRSRVGRERQKLRTRDARRVAAPPPSWE